MVLPRISHRGSREDPTSTLTENCEQEPEGCPRGQVQFNSVAIHAHLLYCLRFFASFVAYDKEEG